MSFWTKSYKVGKKSATRNLPRLIGLTAGVIILIGLISSIGQWQNNNRINSQVKNAIAAANNGVSNGMPSTTPTSTNTFNNYQVPASHPRYIIISKLNVKAIVLPLGVTSNDQIQVPPNIYEAGWYNQSSIPGQSGAMLIYGHVSSWTADGIFYSLKTLVMGDVIQIERGDGRMYSYKVVRKQIYNYQHINMAQVLSPVDPGKPGLNLMTCTGSVIKGTNEFNERLVVFTEQQ